MLLPLKFINDRCKFIFGSLYSISPLLEPSDMPERNIKQLKYLEVK